MMVGFGPAASSSRGATFCFDGAAVALDVALLVVVFDDDVLSVLVSEPQPERTRPMAAATATMPTMALDFIVLTPVGSLVNIETDGKHCSAPVPRGL